MNQRVEIVGLDQRVPIVAWASSVAFHAAAMGIVLLVAGRLALAPHDEPFHWNVTMVERVVQQEPAVQPEPVPPPQHKPQPVVTPRRVQAVRPPVPVEPPQEIPPPPQIVEAKPEPVVERTVEPVEPPPPQVTEYQANPVEPAPAV